MNEEMDRRTLIATGLVGFTLVGGVAEAQEKQEVDPEAAKIAALLKRHDAAVNNHDLEGVIRCLAEKPTILGTGPGEIWSGRKEVDAAYEVFFQGHDKGQQSYEYFFQMGGLNDGMSWFVTSGNVHSQKDGKEFSYPINVSLTLVKEGDGWKIAMMHYSILPRPLSDKKEGAKE